MACIAWHLWFRRNHLIHKKKIFLPQESFKGAVSVWCNFQKSKCLGNNPKPKATCWEPPPLGVHKVNVDGELFFYSQKAGIGFIVQNHDGEVQLAASIAEMNFDNPAVIKALVALRSLQLYMHNGFSNIILESDYLCLMEEILSPANSSLVLGNLVVDDRNLMPFFTTC